MRKLLSSEYIPFGSQYYRAPSPARSEWERDLANFSAAGFNTIKFWVQWRWNNPREGEFAFDDIDQLMDIAHTRHLRVMLNTIVDVAPAWIYRKYPDVSMRTLDGRNIGPQVQPHRQIGGLGVCFNHAPAMEHLFEFLRTSFRRYKDHPALEMWNVASEPELTSSMAELRLYAEDAEKIRDMLCYCDRCTTAFRSWLSVKYTRIEELNAAWKRNYADFSEVEVPVTRNSFNDMIDWRMFFVHTLDQHVRRRFTIAAEEDGGKHPLMCHHVFIQGFPVTSTASDPWNVGKYGDLHGITQMDDPAMCDILRSCAGGKPVISAEMLMLFGYTLDMPTPITMNDIKRYVFNGVAANLKGFIFWQYRPEVLAREAPSWGLTRLDGSSTPWLEAYAEVNRVIQKNATFLLDAAPRAAEVALLYSPENQVFGWAATGNEKNVTDALLGVHQALYGANLVIDVLHPCTVSDAQLTRYKVIVVPFPYLLDASTCSALAGWVERGGTLIGESYFAGWNKEKGQHHTTVPGNGLDKVFCAHQVQVAPPDAVGRVEIIVAADLPHIRRGDRVIGALVQEELSPDGAEVLATFPTGEAAVTAGRHGKGVAILIGSYLGMPYYRFGHPATAQLLVSLVDKYATISRPYIAENVKVRVDVLSTTGDACMIILRNLESTAVHAKISVPGVSSRRLIEQFSGEEIVLTDDGDAGRFGVHLEAAEVKVYRG
jgi:beta-galactosidase GanA